MIAYYVTDFEGRWPTGTAAIVYANGREQAKRTLQRELQTQGLGNDDPDEWKLTPITPMPKEPKAVVLLDGDY